MNILTKWLRAYVPNITADDHQLAEDLTLRGIAVEGVHDLGLSAAGQPNGHLFEMDITTNRVDAMNHYGIAREAATIYDLPLLPLIAPITEPGAPLTTAPPSWVGSPAKPSLASIEAPDLCGRFTARILRDVTIAPSTGQVAEHFTLLGIKQISNAVDASNFVLQAMGHPTHAFDLDKIVGGIVVRLARPGETLRLLDGSERTLAPDDLVIADHNRAISLAGVMGGWDTMITAATRNILVESAWFDPASVRRSARRHGLHTDASHRFERGADLAACPTANTLVSNLILASGGQPAGELIDILIPEVGARTASRPAISLSVQQVQRHLGRTLDDTPTQSALTPTLITQYLTALGCALNPERTSEHEQRTPFLVHLPSWRLDLTREIDLIEEIARVFGYNRFANTLPTPLAVTAHPLAAAESVIRTRLIALGYSEAISSTFASASDAQIFAASGPGLIPLENPLSEEARLLRPSLVPGMVAMLAHNLNRDVREARLFEAGAIFTGTTAEVIESASLSLGLTGNLAATPLHTAKDTPIFELKGAVESLLSLFDLTLTSANTPSSRPEPEAERRDPRISSSFPPPQSLAFTPEAPAWLEPGRSATALLHGKPIAHFGELASAQRDSRKLRQPIFLAQIDLAALYALPLRRATARELSRFQAVERDFSFTFADSIPWRTVAQTIEALELPSLIRLTPTEIFRDPKGTSVPPGHYALLLRCVFQSPDRTLREDELTDWWSKIIAALTALGGTIRA